jgi:hypothetical protein
VGTVPSTDRNGPPPRSRDEGYGGFRGPGVGDRNGGDRNVAPRPAPERAPVRSAPDRDESRSDNDRPSREERRPGSRLQ